MDFRVEARSQKKKKFIEKFKEFKNQESQYLGLRIFAEIKNRKSINNNI